MPTTESLDALRIPPGVGSKGSSKFNTLRNEFGDGHSQRVRNGLNSKKRMETYVWDALPIALARTLIDFLEARGTDEAFLWTPPDGSGVQRQFTLIDIEYPYQTGGQALTVNTTFQEEFDL